MDGNIAWVLGFLCGLSIVGIFLAATKKDGSFRCKYDERQQLVRGRGFKYGFFGWMVFNAVYILGDIGFGIQYMDTPMALFCGMVIGVGIYVSYCIWHGGYFSLNENPKKVLVALAAAALLNIACAARCMHRGLLENGILTFDNGANLFCAAASVTALAVSAVKWHTDQGKEE